MASSPGLASRVAHLGRRLYRRTDGQDLIEYGVLIALVAAGVIIAASQLGVKLPGLYEPTVAALPGEPGGGNPGNGNPGNDRPVGNPGSGAPSGSNPGGQ